MRDARQVKKVEHELVELLVVTVCAVLVRVETFVELEAWTKEKLDQLLQYLILEQYLQRTAQPGDDGVRLGTRIVLCFAGVAGDDHQAVRRQA